MNKVVDILNREKGLRDVPYDVPEGYFEGLHSALLEKIGNAPRRASAFFMERRVVPSLAAAVLLFVIAGGFIFLNRPSNVQDEFSELEYLTDSDVVSITDPESAFFSRLTAESAVSEEDIAEYLIYTGITAEEIENADHSE